MPSLELDPDGLKKLRAAYRNIDTDKMLAARLAISEAQINRIRRGISRPGHDFIAAICGTFGKHWFGELFRVVK